MGLEPVPDEYCPRCLGLVEPGTPCLRCAEVRHLVPRWLLFFGPVIFVFLSAFVLGYLHMLEPFGFARNVLIGAFVGNRQGNFWPEEWPRPQEWIRRRLK